MISVPSRTNRWSERSWAKNTCTTLLIGLILTISAPTAWGLEKKCRKQFRSKDYVSAARCYESIFKQVDAKKELASVRTVLKDRYLQQGAVAWNQAGAASANAARKGWCKEQAIRLLKRSLQEKLCRASRRCIRHTAWIAQLKREIQYVPLTVATGDAKATIQVQGYRFDISRRQRLQEQLRPGTYTLTIATPNKPKRTRQLTLKPGSKLLINITPIKIQVVEKQVIVARRIPPLVLVGYIGGSALLIAGGILIAYGIVQQGELNAIRQDTTRNQNQTDAEFNEAFDQAQVLAGVGAILAGTGGLLFGAGVIAHALSSKGKQPPPPSSNGKLMGRFGWPTTGRRP